MNAETAAHLRKASENLDEASVLLREKFVSGSTSSSYYAMFHAAQAMLAEEGLSLKSHDAVRAKFGEIFIANKKSIDSSYGKMLSRALGLRIDADYGLDARAEITEQIAQGQLEDARKFVAMARKYLGK